MGAKGLEFQQVVVDFTGGVDTRTNQKLRVPGKWDLLTNCVLSKDGTITKRDGVRALVADANGHGLAIFDDELLTINGTNVRTIATSPTNTSVAVPGQIACLHVEKKEVARSTTEHDMVDCAIGNGLEAYVWRESDAAGTVLGIYACVIDSTTRAYLMRPTQISTNGYLPRVVYLTDAFMFIWIDFATLNLTAAIYGTSPGIGLGPSISLAVAVPARCLDAVAFGIDSAVNHVRTAAVSYMFNDGVTSVRCSQVTYSPATLIPAIMTTTNLFTEAQLPVATICGLGMALTNTAPGNTGFAATFVASPLSGAAMSGVAGNAISDAWAAAIATRVDGVVGIFATNAETHVVATRHPIAATPFSMCQVYVDGFADVGGAGGIGVRPLRSYQVFVQGVGLALSTLARTTILNSVTTTETAALQGPFIAGYPMVIKAPVSGVTNALETIALPLHFVSATNAEVIQSGVFVVDGLTGEVIGKGLYGQTKSFFTQNSSSPSCPRRGSSTAAHTSQQTFVLPVLEQGRLEILNGANVTASGVAALIVSPNMPVLANAAGAWAPRRIQIGRNTMIANGMLSSYDGLRVGEADFNVFPEGITVSVAAGGGTWTAGTYQFCAIYESVDGQGQRHQSAPSPPVQVVIAANSTVTVYVPTLQLTQRTNVRHVIFCTQANGTILNRFGALGAPADALNDKTTARSTIVVLAEPPAGNELLYSQPFVADTTLPNDAPGPCSKLAVHQNRLWLSLDDSPGSYRYSQPLVEGVGLQFNETLGGVLPVDSGRIVGFASMDEMLVILTERKLYRITGSGPTVSGGYNGYSDPVEIPSDVGCNSVASVLSTPDGVMFRSEKGWYVLSRGLEVKYVGGPIKRWDSDLISSIVMLRDRQEIRVSSSQTFDTAFGGALQFVYSYVPDAWSVFQVTSFTTTPLLSNSLMVFDAVWWRNRYVTISYYDGLNEDWPGVYIDQPGANVDQFAIGMSARSSFLHLSALEGYQRVRWLYLTASAPAAPATNLSFRVDFDDLYQVKDPPGAPGCYLTAGLTLTALPFANPASVDLRHKFRRQKCKSVAITVNENPIAAGDPGLTGFQALALQIGVRRGTNRLRAEQVVP